MLITATAAKETQTLEKYSLGRSSGHSAKFAHSCWDLKMTGQVMVMRTPGPPGAAKTNCQPEKVSVRLLGYPLSAGPMSSLLALQPQQLCIRQKPPL